MIAKTERKKPGPKPTGKGEQIVVRMHQPQIDALDLWASGQSDDMSRPEAIRRLLRSHPELKRYLGDGK